MVPLKESFSTAESANFGHGNQSDIATKQEERHYPSFQEVVNNHEVYLSKDYLNKNWHIISKVYEGQVEAQTSKKKDWKLLKFVHTKLKLSLDSYTGLVERKESRDEVAKSNKQIQKISLVFLKVVKWVSYISILFVPLGIFIDKKIKVFQKAISETDELLKKAITAEDVALEKFSKLDQIWQTLSEDNAKQVLEELKSSDELAKIEMTPEEQNRLIKYVAKLHLYRLYSYTKPGSEIYVPIEANENWSYWKAIYMHSVKDGKKESMNKLFDAIAQKIVFKDFIPKRVLNIRGYEIPEGQSDWKEGDKVKVLYLS